MASASKKPKSEFVEVKQGGDLVSIGHLNAAIASVGLVRHPSWSGSCCVVSLPKLQSRIDRRLCILTNEHVIPTKEDAAKVVVEFEGVAKDMKTVSVRATLDPSDYFVCSKELDFALVALVLLGLPESVIVSAVDLGQALDVRRNDVINIVQHPRGGAKQISTHVVLVCEQDYFESAAEIQSGSSGSPVFSNWKICGLTKSTRVDNDHCRCIHIRSVLAAIGAIRPVEEFFEKHRTLLHPSPCWEWITSSSRYHPVDILLEPLEKGETNVLLLACTEEPVCLRTSDSCDVLPSFAMEPKLCRGVSAFVFPARIVSLTSSSRKPAFCRFRVLRALEIQVPFENAVHLAPSSSANKQWIVMRGCKGKFLEVIVRLKNVFALREQWFVSLHSKEDLIRSEASPEAAGHHVVRVEEETSLTLQSQKDYVFARLSWFWESRRSPSFSVVIREIKPTPKNRCTATSCSICGTKGMPAVKVEVPQLQRLITGPLHSVVIRRLSGSVWLQQANWREEKTMVQWGNTQVEHSMYAIRECKILTDHSSFTVVAKTLRPELAARSDRNAWYSAQVQMQSIAQEVAQHWNRLCEVSGQGHAWYISFVEVSLFNAELRQEIGLIEEALEALEFCHFTDNVGKPLVRGEGSDLAVAFSHFSAYCSGGRVLVCNVKGSKQRFTGPVVHCKGVAHPCSLGQEAVRTFFGSHQCNRYCKTLKLPPV